MIIKITMMAAMMVGFGETAHAVPDALSASKGAHFTLQCAKTCVGGGFRVDGQT